MIKKDVIIRIQGNQESVQKAMDKLSRKSNKLGIPCISQDIKEISTDLDKLLVKKTKTKDISISFNGEEKNVKKALEQIITAVHEELQITPNSEEIKIERKKDEKK